MRATIRESRPISSAISAAILPPASSTIVVRPGTKRSCPTLDTGCRDGVNYVTQQFVRLAPLEQRVWRQCHAVPQGRQGDTLDVVRRHVIPILEQRSRPSSADQRQRAAGARAEG